VNVTIKSIIPDHSVIKKVELNQNYTNGSESGDQNDILNMIKSYAQTNTEHDEIVVYAVPALFVAALMRVIHVSCCCQKYFGKKN